MASFAAPVTIQRPASRRISIPRPVLITALQDKAEGVRAAAELALAEIWSAGTSPPEERGGSPRVGRPENAPASGAA